MVNKAKVICLLIKSMNLKGATDSLNGMYSGKQTPDSWQKQYLYIDLECIKIGSKKQRKITQDLYIILAMTPLVED